MQVMFRRVWLGGAPWAVRVLDYAEAVQVGVEPCVAYPQACYDCIQDPDGEVNLPVLGVGVSVSRPDEFISYIYIFFLYRSQ